MPKFKILETDYNNFKDICSVGAEFKNEEGKVSTKRMQALYLLGVKLHNAVMAATAYQRQRRKLQSTNATGVKALTAFHEAQAELSWIDEQARLNEEVVYIRKWLSRQGATFWGLGGIDLPNLKNTRVIYDADPALQESTKVTISGGRLLSADGKPFDTARMVTMQSGPGYAIYVMSAEGNFHVRSHSVGYYHHSSLLAGADVAGAGEIKVKNGKIKKLSNKSGHYTPGHENLLQVLAMLQKKDVDLDFKLMVMPSGREYPSVSAFMTDQRLDDASIQRVTQAMNLVSTIPVKQRGALNGAPENHVPVPKQRGALNGPPGNMNHNAATAPGNHVPAPKQRGALNGPPGNMQHVTAAAAPTGMPGAFEPPAKKRQALEPSVFLNLK